MVRSVRWRYPKHEITGGTSIGTPVLIDNALVQIRPTSMAAHHRDMVLIVYACRIVAIGNVTQRIKHIFDSDLRSQV